MREQRHRLRALYAQLQCLRITVRTKVSQDRGCLPHKAGMGKVKAQLLVGKPAFQLFRRACGDDLSFMQDRDLISEQLCFFQILCRQEAVVPDALSCRIASQLCLRLPGSKPVVGSSRKSTCGSFIRLIAMSRRRFMPPEYVLTL